ncbi:SAF domain-containing protein (plasmid) [Micromonospora zamorensis]|uniref:SAF domain-containing protein n=1 Tax=Micromonospora zamorensis TaxID=709883 RepID=UPI002E1ACA97
MTATLPAETGRAVTAGIAVPRLAAQRRWRPSLLWFGVALVVVGALIGWKVLTAVGTTDQYLAVGRAVDFGAALTRDDLTTVRISSDPALQPIRASEVDAVLGQRAAMPLVAGTLLTQAQLTDRAIPGAGQQLVGLGLPQTRVPSARVEPGAKVLLVITAPATAIAAGDNEPAAPPLNISATVVDVGPGAKDGETQLNVSVAERDGPLVASRAAEGRIVVLMTAGS